LFRHRATGCLIPAVIPGLRVTPADLLTHNPASTGADPALVSHLRAHFEFEGVPSDTTVKSHLRVLLGQAGAGVRVFILLANASGTDRDGHAWVAEGLYHRNEIIAEVASEFPSVELLNPAHFMSPAEVLAQTKRHHFDRMVYFRIFQHIMAHSAASSAE
jgi:hypothetical protein